MTTEEREFWRGVREGAVLGASPSAILPGDWDDDTVPAARQCHGCGEYRPGVRPVTLTYREGHESPTAGGAARETLPMCGACVELVAMGWSDTIASARRIP